MDTVEVKSSAFALLGALFSSKLGWITAVTFKETIAVAVISTIIGYYGGKLLVFLDKLIKAKIKKKKDQKA